MAASIYKADALRLLADGKPHTLKLWKMSTGDILIYKDAVFVSRVTIKGTHKVRLPLSHLIREFRDITLFEIDGLKIFL
jgi:hypothetical protein